MRNGVMFFLIIFCRFLSVKGDIWLYLHKILL